MSPNNSPLSRRRSAAFKLIRKLPFLYIFLVSSLFSLACVKEVTNSFPDYKREIVLNGILNAGLNISVHVSETSGLSEAPLNNIDNAIVILTRDNLMLDTLESTGDGFYLSSIMAESGQKYTCEAHINGKEIVHAIDSVPYPAESIQITHRMNEGITNEGFLYPAIDLTISNNPQQKQYFEVILLINKSGEQQVAEWFQITDTLVTREGLPIAIFSNEHVSSDSIHVTLPYITNTIRGNTYESFPFMLEVRSVSPAYFEFAKNRYLYDLSRYPEVIIGTPPAVNLYSNVINGTGFFGAMSIYRSEEIDPN